MPDRSVHRPRLLPVLLLALAGGALASAGCRTVPKVPGADVEVLYRGTLQEVGPVDVVVAPIGNSSGSREVPLETLREAFVDGLVLRRYSPLAIPYVDRQVVEAAYSPGSLREDAVLQIEVVSWDTSEWESSGAISVAIEAWMLDATQPGRAELWGGRLEERMVLTQEMARFATSSALFRDVCEQLATKILEAMPARPASA